MLRWRNSKVASRNLQDELSLQPQANEKGTPKDAGKGRRKEAQGTLGMSHRRGEQR